MEALMDWKLELVVVPVTDVDRAKAFYADQLGFVVDVDSSPSEDIRIVQLTPPGSACSIMVGKGMTSAVPGSLEGLQICVGDIDAAHAQLVERGVECSPIQRYGAVGLEDGKGEDWNSFVFFKDPDGNSWAVQESPTIRRQMLESAAAAGSA
jgi:catechol 2,3-dioxygenase-like lactoylglutathione lyase family enzyme